MKVLSVFYINDTADFKDNVGLNYVNSVLQKSGHQVISIHDRFINFNLEPIIEYSPDFILFSLYDWYLHETLSIIKKIKATIPDVTIIVGGPTVHSSAIQLLTQYPEINYAIYGEGESAIISLIEQNKPLSEIENLCYREHQVIKKTHNSFISEYELNELPIPDSTIPFEYSNYIYVGGGRGCTGNCSFCCTRSTWKNWRQKSNESILDDLEYKIKRYSRRNVFFTFCSIDNPDGKVVQFVDLCKTINKRNIDISFLAPLRAETYRNINHEDIISMKQAGLYGFFIGYEAGNDFDLKLYHKRATLTDCSNSADHYTNEDLYVEPGFISINPYSTPDRIIENTRWLKNHNYSYYHKWVFSYYMPFRGCALFDKIQTDKLLVDNGFEKPILCKYQNNVVDNLITSYLIYIKSSPNSPIIHTNIFVEINKIFAKTIALKYKNEKYFQLSEYASRLKNDNSDLLMGVCCDMLTKVEQLLEGAQYLSRDDLLLLFEQCFYDPAFINKIQKGGIIMRKMLHSIAKFDSTLLAMYK